VQNSTGTSTNDECLILKLMSEEIKYFVNIFVYYNSFIVLHLLFTVTFANIQIYCYTISSLIWKIVRFCVWATITAVKLHEYSVSNDVKVHHTLCLDGKRHNRRKREVVVGEVCDSLIFRRRVYAGIVNCKIYQDQRGRHNSGGLLSRWYEAWRPDSA